MSGDAPRYLLDANAFDFLLDRAIDPKAVRRLGEILVTDVQHGELLDVPDPRRRKRLLRVLSAVDPIVRPAFDDALPDGRHPLDRAVRRGSSRSAREAREISRERRRWKDAALVAVASRDGCTVVTDDGGARERAARLGVPALSCAEAFAALH